MTPERLAEIREQVANKFPSWTAMQDLLEALDKLSKQFHETEKQLSNELNQRAREVQYWKDRAMGW